MRIEILSLIAWSVIAGGEGDIVVELCDGETKLALKGKKPGDEITKGEAQKLSAELMAEWSKKNPGKTWLLAQANVQSGHTYGAFDQRDEKIWAASTQAFIDEGDRIFHDAKALGGTIAVSCDMCHPNAANTHPETYPKYQVQLGRVALLRDMINWCIEHPVRGKPLAADSNEMRAMEAYIYAQRKGVALEFGKH